jgi:hypothetical protein
MLQNINRFPALIGLLRKLTGFTVEVHAIFFAEFVYHQITKLEAHAISSKVCLT